MLEPLGYVVWMMRRKRKNDYTWVKGKNILALSLEVVYYHTLSIYYCWRTREFPGSLVVVIAKGMFKFSSMYSTWYF